MSRFQKILLTISAVFFVITGILQYLKWKNFGYNGLDLAIYTQTVWSLAHGHGFANSIHDPTYRADHLEPILFLFAPLYRIWSNPLLLLWLQTIAIAVSGFLAGILAKKYLTEKWSLFFAAIFLAHPFVYNAAMYEFHGLTFALPLIFASIITYEKRQWLAWAILVGLTALIREDLPLLAIGWAIFAAFRRVPWRYWVSVAVLGICWFAGAHWLIAEVRPTSAYKYLAFVSWLDPSISGMLTFPLRHPIIFLQHVLSINNWGVGLGLLAGFGFLPIFAIASLTPLILVFAQELVLGASASSFLRLHYVIPYLPFLFWASLIAFDRVRQRIIWKSVPAYITTTLVAILAIVGPLYLQFSYGWAEWPWQKKPNATTTSSQTLKEALTKINSDDRVLSVFSTLPALSNRSAIYSLNYVYLGRRQYSEEKYTVPGPIDAAVIDWRQFYEYQFLYRDTMFEGQTGEQRIAALLEENGLKPYWSKGGVTVYRKNGSAETSSVAELPATPATGFKLISSSAHKTKNGLKLILRWHADYTSGTPVSLQINWLENGRLREETRLLGESFRPATTWSSDHDWQVTLYLDSDSNQNISEINVAWLSLTGQYRFNRWREFRPLIKKSETIGRAAVPLTN